eukprot:4089739-Prymnesium_polylepis.1
MSPGMSPLSSGSGGRGAPGPASELQCEGRGRGSARACARAASETCRRPDSRLAISCAASSHRPPSPH